MPWSERGKEMYHLILLQKVKMVANEVENHLLNYSLSNDDKENWQHYPCVIVLTQGKESERD